MKRRKLKEPKICRFCNEIETDFRIQGHPYGGKAVCAECWEQVKEKERQEVEREQSEAEWQIERRWGI